jgi:hypothetical protein
VQALSKQSTRHVYELARVRLSNGRVLKSKENKNVPPAGTVQQAKREDCAHHDYCCSALVSLFSQRLFSWQMYSMISPFGTQLMSKAMVQGRVYAPGSSMVA